MNIPFSIDATNLIHQKAQPSKAFISFLLLHTKSLYIQIYWLGFCSNIWQKKSEMAVSPVFISLKNAFLLQGKESEPVSVNIISLK
jgi:hypothetical protein